MAPTAHLTRRARRTLALAAALGCLGFAAYVVAVTSDLLGSQAAVWLNPAVLTLAGALVIARSVLVSGERVAWAAFGAAMLLIAAAWTLYTVVVQRADPIPYPSVSDVFWLSAYAINYVALALLMRSRLRSFAAALWLDGIIGLLAVGALGAAVLVPVIDAATGAGGTAAVATSLA